VRREPIVYGALLAASLLMAFRTWRAADRPDAPRGVELWRDRTGDIQAIEFERPGTKLQIQRRGAGSDSAYYWATTDTAAYLVGKDAGKRLLDALAAPVAERDLGKPSAADRRAFGLDTARERITVRLSDRTRRLLVGATVYSTDERYVLDEGSGHVYPLRPDITQTFENADGLLPERRMHAFAPDQVGGVTVSGGGRTRAMRRAGDNPATGGNWVAPNGDQKPDVAFAAFMQQLSQLYVQGYAPRETGAGLTLVMRVDYTDKRGRPLGYLELLSRPASGPTPDYFLRSELTRGFVHGWSGTADNVAKDLPQVLNAGGGRTSARTT